MADPPEREHAEPRRTSGIGNDRPEMDAAATSDEPAPPPHEERPSGFLNFLKLQLGMFVPVVILGIVFLVVIILFAVTR